MSITFDGNYMKQGKVVYNHDDCIINIYIVYKLGNKKKRFAEQNCLFGAVKLRKGTNKSHYQYSDYGICFDRNIDFTIGNIING